MASTLLNNIVSYWKLDGDSTDAVGTNNGTDTAITYVAGKINQAAEYGGASRIDVGNGISLQGDFSISAWVNLATISSTVSQVLIAKDLSGTNYPQFIIQSNLDGTMKGAVYSTNGPTPSATATSTTIFSPNTWYHIVLIRDGTNLIIYINGTSEDSVAWSTAQWASTDTVSIGASKNSSGTPELAILNGGMTDEGGIWSRALTSTEVTELYNSGAGLQYPFAPPVTVHPSFLLNFLT